MAKSFLEDVVLEEGGIQACIERWRKIDLNALAIEMLTYVMQKPVTRANMVEWLEAELRRKNEETKKRRDG